MKLRFIRALLLCLSACADAGSTQDHADTQVARLTREQLLDPETCRAAIHSITANGRAVCMLTPPKTQCLWQ